MSKKFPTNARNARRSLRFVKDGTRSIVGSFWLPARIIADSKEQAAQVAMMIWANGGRMPEEKV